MCLPIRLSPIAATLPSAKAISVTLFRPCDGSTTRPPLNTRSFIRLPCPSARLLPALSHPGHGFRQRARAGQGYVFEAEPVRHQTQLVAQRFRDLGWVLAVFEMGCMDDKRRVGAVGLEIDAR